MTLTLPPPPRSFLRDRQVLGRIGFLLSFVPWLTFGLMLIVRPS